MSPAEMNRAWDECQRFRGEPEAPQQDRRAGRLDDVEARNWLRKHNLYKNKPRRMLVSIHHGTDLLSPLRGSREPDYMTVEQRPASIFRFRFRLNEDSHDDSTGRHFDWWLEDLTTMATEAREQGGAAPEISVFERVYENGIYYQNMWTGFLGKDANDSPRRAENDLFQFELKAASFSRTWTTEEAMQRLDDGLTGSVRTDRDEDD